MTDKGAFPFRASGAFAFLIAAQAAHSVEEYVTRLYDVLRPAAFVSGLFNSDLPTGFAIANTILVAIGVGCWFFAARYGGPIGKSLAWGWAALEAVNAFAHIARAIRAGGYFPGLATAPVLLLGSAWLALNLRQRP